MEKLQHPDGDADLDASVPWLEEEHVTLLEEQGAQSAGAAESERPKRYDDTQRIWCPPSD